MPAPILALPALLGTRRSSDIHRIEDLAAILKPRYAIHDLELVRLDNERPRQLRFQVGSQTIGCVGLTSVLGPPLGLTVDPLEPSCMLALPSHGCGAYRMGGDRISNAAGQTVAYLPSGGWRLVNDHTGGTALHFTEDALIRCIQAMASYPLYDGSIHRAVLRSRLATPFVIPTDASPTAELYKQLLSVMAMVHDMSRSGLAEPHPMLCLDDLILRSVALLLLPVLGRRGAGRALGDAQTRDLTAAVNQVMEWMLANLHRPISLSDIEEQANYGRRALQAAFRARVGCGPMQWLRRQRLDQAMNALQSPGPQSTVTSVAHACGYFNLSGFSRDFQQRFGITARQVLAAGRSRIGS